MFTNPGKPMTVYDSLNTVAQAILWQWLQIYLFGLPLNHDVFPGSGFTHNFVTVRPMPDNIDMKLREETSLQVPFIAT